ncbi:helix-turn-helix domain-containing protein [Streptomyces sp. NPDC020845]|uniref:helix-turn-helix domain-containing protein n=1 Tax=Streptomyces sp. NPDC020845 TaxID=3365096 RepID=UPI0037A6528A
MSLCSDGTSRAARSGALTGGFSDSGQVWLERTGTPLPLDDIVLDRFAIAAAILSEYGDEPPAKVGDADLVELALSASAEAGERARALRLMGLDPTVPLTVPAVEGDGVAEPLSRQPGVRAARLGHVHAVLLPHHPSALPTTGARIGVGPSLPGLEAPESWQQARTALRFAAMGAPSPAVVHAGELGALAAIATGLRRSDIAEVTDVAALDLLAAQLHGEATPQVLTALCATGSVRKAAASVYRHHSTVADRLTRAEAHLGFSFTTPAGWLRLELALLLRNLRDSAEG